VRVAAVYDIHGNLPALESVLAEIRQADVDRIVIGGDVVPGPMPSETLDLVLGLGLPTDAIQGNGESAVLAAFAGDELRTVPEAYREGIRWTARQLRPDQREAIASWPATVRIDMDPLGSVLFCHATPRNHTEIFTRLTPEERVSPAFDGVEERLVVCGHTHMQFDRIVGSKRVVNAGSVGMPFGSPDACWLLLGPEVRMRRTGYDVGGAAERIRRTSYPGAHEFAERNVLRPPSEEAMLELFTRGELK